MISEWGMGKDVEGTGFDFISGTAWKDWHKLRKAFDRIFSVSTEIRHQAPPHTSKKRCRLIQHARYREEEARAVWDSAYVGSGYICYIGLYGLSHLVLHYSSWSLQLLTWKYTAVWTGLRSKRPHEVSVSITHGLHSMKSSRMPFRI
jgi:hypothetical protein